MNMLYQPPPGIFVSHSHSDDDFCRKLVQDLRREIGDEDAVWYDAAGGLKGGDPWWQHIIAELKARAIFLVVLSPDALTSPWVNDEIDLAWKFKNTLKGRRIIPILYQPCHMREDLSMFQAVSFLPFRPYEEALNELLKVIREPVSSVKENWEPLVAVGSPPIRKRGVLSLRWVVVGLVVLALLFGSFFELFHSFTTKNISTESANNSSGPAKPGTQPCPSPANTTKHWLSILGIKSDSQGLPEDSIEGVYCANLEGNGSLQALILDRSLGSAALLAVDVYNNITSAKPTLVFQQKDLYQGNAKISTENTIMTAAVDGSSAINKSVVVNSEYKQDLFQEYQWSNQQHRFTQIVFNGLFPDLTRWQAESDQKSVNSGIDLWKLDAKQTAQHFVASLLRWDINTPAAITNGGGSHDLNAVIKLGSSGPGNSVYQVTLRRFNNDASNGIWEVTNASYEPEERGFAVDVPVIATIDQPSYGDTIHSPLPVTGRCDAFSGRFGVINILDHLYTIVGNTNAIQSGVDPLTKDRSYKATVNYHATYSGEEGIVALYINGAGSSVAAVLMTKVILNSTGN